MRRHGVDRTAHMIYGPNILGQYIIFTQSACVFVLLYMRFMLFLCVHNFAATTFCEHVS